MDFGLRKAFVMVEQSSRAMVSRCSGRCGGLLLLMEESVLELRVTILYLRQMFDGCAWVMHTLQAPVRLKLLHHLPLS